MPSYVLWSYLKYPNTPVMVVNLDIQQGDRCKIHKCLYSACVPGVRMYMVHLKEICWPMSLCGDVCVRTQT
jgi:hypothetical protein